MPIGNKIPGHNPGNSQSNALISVFLSSQTTTQIPAFFIYIQGISGSGCFMT